jgi:hypothetical protein
MANQSQGIKRGYRYDPVILEIQKTRKEAGTKGKSDHCFRLGQIQKGHSE